MLDENKPSKLLGILKEQMEAIFSLTNYLTDSELDALYLNEAYFQKNMVSELEELKVVISKLMTVIPKE